MRILFTRNIKLPVSGAKAKKKPWSLLQTMIFLKPYVTAEGIDQGSNLPSLTFTVDDSSAADNTQKELIDDVVPFEKEPVEDGAETNKGTESGNSRTVESRTIKSHPQKRVSLVILLDE